MRRSALIASTVAAGILLGAMAACADEESDRQGPGKSVALDVHDDTTVDLQLPPGEVYIEGTDGETLRATMVVRCDHEGRDCDRLAEALDFDVDVDEDRVVIDTRGWKTGASDSSHVEVDVEVPKIRRLYVSVAAGELSIRRVDAKSLDVRLKAGELRVRDVAACPRVDVLAGEVRLDMPLRLVSSVRLDAGIGESELITPDTHIEGRRAWLLGSEIDWDQGPGDCDIDVDVQVGEARVELTD